MRDGDRGWAPTSPRSGRREHTTRAQRSRGRRVGCGRRDRRGRWTLWLELSALVLLLAASIPSYPLFQHGRVVVPFERHASTRGRRASGSVVSSTATTLPPPTTPPTPTPAPDSNLAANMRMGCTLGKPPVQPGVIFHGTNRALKATPPQEVALTFDDGPTPYSTAPILSYLEATHTPATFMVEGQYVHLWPYLVQREWRDGFAIGIHTWDHPDMTRLSPAARQFQLGATLNALHAALGQRACIWFWRPPYGAYNQAVVQTAASFGLSTVRWDVDPRDWSRPGTSVIVSRVLAQVHAGAIILMHDGPALRDETRAALPAILAGLRARGLTPVTLPQLLEDGGYLRTPVNRGVSHQQAARAS